MALPIVVAPEGDIWAVRSEALDTQLTFAQGGPAEAAARQLAREIAAQGRLAEVSIFLKDGVLAGRFLHAPPSAMLAA